MANEDLPEQTTGAGATAGADPTAVDGAQTTLPGEDATDASMAGAAPGGTAIDRGTSDQVTDLDSGGDSVADDDELPDETTGPTTAD
ncbi:hypothetical protein NB037_06565 [Rathayibacter sp. ZW T2_19]|uniref:Uncharacterized protein n=1 Tax=Rathayibacter rubneri TaxID=2950106 RepID=A0A9X2DVZ5_9MICO|nr:MULTISPECIES: hypothetical protein [Rathayibacter]MBO0983880.1 hypothetical protein [Rathayibacter sp. SD072]MCM6762080.1 hypothetical protein [Rathayibacter rubneri]